jgi:hypothetical protein
MPYNPDRYTELSGELYRNGKWDAPLRPLYSTHKRHIESGAELRAALRAGSHAWPGGYSVAFVTSDSAALCFKCARDNLRLITDSIRQRSRDGWRIVAITGEHESDSACHCDNCNAEVWAGWEDESDSES